MTSNSDEMESTDLKPQESTALGQEKSGQGAADQENVSVGGQRGDVGKQQSGSKQRQDKRHRPGHSEMDRSLGKFEIS